MSVEQYQRMYQTGILKATPKTELIEGYIVEMEPMDPPDAFAIGIAMDFWPGRIPVGWHCRIQTPITLSGSQPQPDVAIVQGTRADFPDCHPQASQIDLLIEVADSSLGDDRRTKLRLYARNRIRVYWILNLPDRQLEVYTLPVTGNNPRYRQCQNFAEADTVTFVLGPHTIGPIAVADLLPPA